MEGKVIYGSNYHDIMGFNDDGHMNHVFGAELSKEAEESWRSNMKHGSSNFTGKFGTGESTNIRSSWSVSCKDVVLVSRDLYVNSHEQFTEQYGRSDYWESNNIFVEEMTKYLGVKLTEEEVDIYMAQTVAGRGEMTMREWTFDLSWFCNEDSNALLICTKSADLSNNILTVMRKSIEFSISRKKSEDDTIFFVDGEDGKSYEIEKSSVEKTKDGTLFIMKAKNLKTDEDVTNRVWDIMSNKGTYPMISIHASRNKIESINLDSLISAIYSIGDIEEEYKSMMVDKFIKNKYPSLSNQDINTISHELTSIEKRASVFQMET